MDTRIAFGIMNIENWKNWCIREGTCAQSVPSLMLRCGLGYSWDIHRVFMGYTYVSVMCRLCIGYVSVTCRNRRRAKKEEKVHFFGEKFGNVRGFLYLCRRKWETGRGLRQLASIGLSIQGCFFWNKNRNKDNRDNHSVAPTLCHGKEEQQWREL